MFWSVANAQTAGGGATPSGFEMFIPFIFIFVIFYFLIIRPQANKQKTHQKFITELKRGEAVVTTSGILGTIEGLTETFVTLEIAPNVRIKILRSQILSSQSQATAATAGKTTEGKA
jgi:preprotein translocase subunit YajC